MTVSKIEIDVKTQYLAAQSNPDAGQYVFSYTITITNESSQWYNCLPVNGELLMQTVK